MLKCPPPPRQPRSTPIEQDQALLEQLVAALDLAELRQQASQLGAGLGTALEAQAGLQVFPGLAPELVDQAQAPQGQQQAGIVRMFLEPTFRGLQLLARIAPAHLPVELHQGRVEALLERMAEDFFSLFLGAQAKQLGGIARDDRRVCTQRRRHVLPALGQRLQRRLALVQSTLAGFLQGSHPGTAFEVAQFGILQHTLLAQLRQQDAKGLPVVLGDVQLLHQPQYRAVLRLEPVQLFKGIACLRVVAAIDQQLRTGQADQQWASGSRSRARFSRSSASS